MSSYANILPVAWFVGYVSQLYSEHSQSRVAAFDLHRFHLELDQNSNSYSTDT
jgi:hypothetical protein